MAAPPPFPAMRRLIAILLLGAAALAVATPAPAAPRHVPPGFVGMNIGRDAGDLPTWSDGELGLMARSGVETLRAVVSWSAAEPRRGEVDLTRVDALVLAAARHGIALLPTVLSAPAWAAAARPRRHARAERERRRRAPERSPGPTRPSGLRALPRAAGRPVRLARHAVARPSGGAAAADPRLAGVERARSAAVLDPRLRAELRAPAPRGPAGAASGRPARPRGARGPGDEHHRRDRADDVALAAGGLRRRRSGLVRRGLGPSLRRLGGEPRARSSA